MKTKNKKITMITLALIMLLGVGVFSLNNNSYKVEAKDPVARWLCSQESTQAIYMAAETDYLNYSKSAIVNSSKTVDGTLNKLLSVAGYDFAKANEAILGRKIGAIEASDSSEADPNESAPKVSAFDRFGVAGLSWGSYAGEFKFNYVDPCSEGQELSPTNYGAFYEGRLEPKSAFNETSTSSDPRSIQLSNGYFSLFKSTFVNVLSNIIFSVAKFVVTLTIIFVGMSFSDLTSLIGLSSSGTAASSAVGIFNGLFNTIFSGFVLITFVLTAIFFVYNGIIKKQVRLAFNSLLKAIVIFVVAIIMSINPSFWISVPNKVATYGQALVLNSVAGLYNNNTNYASLCSTNVGALDEGVDFEKAGASKITEFEKVNENMQSVIGCQLWEQFLFKPWVRGQFGTEYENLDSDKLGNINSEWTGKGSVPVGDGKTIDNWALFQLSTLTDAHASLGNENVPVYINGVNSDWWRVVDALSNYDEETVVDKVSAEGESGMVSAELDKTVQVDSEPTEPWQSWIGNNKSERISSAFIAILFGIFGSAAPLTFAFTSIVLGLGITLLMITSPIFLLFGTWGGRGDKIFMGWLSALASTVLKKIIVGFLLIFSIAIINSVMNLAYSVGIISSLLLLIIVMSILVKNKNKLLDMFGRVDFGGTFDPRTGFNKMLNKGKSLGKDAANLSIAATAGGIQGMRTGQGFFRGVSTGTKSRIRTSMYTSRVGRHMIREMDVRATDSSQEQQVCSVCYKQFNSDEIVLAYRDENGNYYCQLCADEMGSEELYEVVLNEDYELPDMYVQNDSPDTRKNIATMNRSYLSHSKTRDLMETRVTKDKVYWNNEQVQSMIKDNVKRLREDITVYSNIKFALGETAKPPTIPEPLHEYIDLALVNEEWTNRNFKIVEDTYKTAWKMWYEDNGKHTEGLTDKEIKEFKTEIENYMPEINTEQAFELVKEYVQSGKSSKAANYDKILDKKHIYSYEKGKLDYSEIKDLVSKENNIKIESKDK